MALKYHFISKQHNEFHVFEIKKYWIEIGKSISNVLIARNNMGSNLVCKVLMLIHRIAHLISKTRVFKTKYLQ